MAAISKNRDTRIAVPSTSARDGPDTTVITSSLLLTLSLANAIGFIPSTVMPVWVGHLMPPAKWPAWYGGAVASVQLAAVTIGNLAAPRVISGLSPRRYAPLAALVVGCGFFLMAGGTPAIVITGSLLSGLGCGILLASANSIAACLSRPQQTFAVLQVALVALGIVLFYLLPRLMAQRGVDSVFIAMGIAGMLASPLFRSLPSGSPRQDTISKGDRCSKRAHRPIALLSALGTVLMCQTALMACILEGAKRVGLDLPSTGTLLSAAAALCLVAPIGARALGERLGILPPLTAGLLALASTAFLLMRASSPVDFAILTAALMGLPVFILPYALTLLARFGEAGRWSAVGPGFMMAGVAAGPVLAGMLRLHLALGGLGTAMAAPIAVAAGVFVAASPRVSTES